MGLLRAHWELSGHGKKEIYKTIDGQVLLDSEGNKIIHNYSRYLPEVSDTSTWIAVLYIIFGIAILLVLEWYANRNKSRVH